MVEVFSVQDGLDAERALLDEVCGGAREHGLLLWQPCDRALVMPRRMERLEGFAPASAAVAERGWPVLLETAYLRLCQPICDWLRERGLDAGVGAVAGSFCDGRYNVTLDGRKLAGTAQRWRRNGAGRPVVLAHAALLVGAEREEMVEVVNTFTRRCGSAPDCQADSHLGLSERWSDFRMADSLELERRFVAARS